MTVNEAINKLGFKALCLCDGEREIHGGYCGDLLSWVMGRADADQAWVTIMSNVNIIAVSTLIDPSCIILAEGVSPDEGVLEKARECGVNILSSDMPAFETAGKLYQVI